MRDISWGVESHKYHVLANIGFLCRLFIQSEKLVSVERKHLSAEAFKCKVLQGTG